MVGYIDTAGGSRDNVTVRKQIATYAGWSNISDNTALRGIYFDHTPYKNVDDAQEYLRNISATVRHADGFGDAPLLVHNPGRVPDADMVVYQPDITVIFEGTYADMPSREELSAQRERVQGKREKLAMLVNSVPGELGRVGVRKIVENVRRDVEWLYLTDLTEHVYEEYGSLLREWLDLIY